MARSDRKSRPAPEGGALKEMLPAFRVGLGGPVGSGQQYWSWVHLADAVAAVVHVLNCPALDGPVNVVAPNPVTNRQFAHTLGHVLHRPSILPTPAFAVRLAFGEMADALLLASARVLPRRLLDSGFLFQFPQLEGALQHLVG